MSADPRIVVRRPAALQYGLLAVAAVAFRWDAGPAGALLGAAAVVLGVAASVAVHEGAHALVAVRSGLRVIGLEVRGLLEASVRRTVTTDARTDVRVRLAGPVATAVLLATCCAALLLPVAGDAVRVLRLLAVVNAVALVVSLVGGRDSDGARAWRTWRAARAHTG